jgi:hypothetical protein
MHSASLIKDLSEDSKPIINSTHCQSSYDVDYITEKFLIVVTDSSKLA